MMGAGVSDHTFLSFWRKDTTGRQDVNSIYSNQTAFSPDQALHVTVANNKFKIICEF